MLKGVKELSMFKPTMCLVAIATFAGGLMGQSKPLFTEDFESGPLDAKKWESRVEGAATVKVQQEQFAHGKSALQVNYPKDAARSYAMVVAGKVPEALRKHHFGRAYVKIAAKLPDSHTVMIFAGEPGWQMSKFNEIGVYKGTFQPSYQENKSARGQGRGETVTHAEAGPPLDKWFLMEWEFSDEPNSITIWIDGQVQTVLAGTEKKEVSKFIWPRGSETSSGLVGANGFEEFGLGARVWGAVPEGFDIFYDDIALDTKRIGAIK
jgi:hypothetical protein